MSKEEKKYNRESYFSAFLLIFLGGVFLLNNFGFLPWSIWGDLWKFWPVFLIFLGLEIIAGGTFIGNWLINALTFLFFLFMAIILFSIINPVFNKYLKDNYPIWNEIKQIFEETQESEFNEFWLYPESRRDIRRR